MTIFLSLWFKKIFFVFPFIQMTWKLGVTLFIMGAFAFGEETFEIRSILAFIILLFGIIVVIIGICYMKKDKTDDIIITDIRQDRDIDR